MTMADYGYGARAPWAALRESDYKMKERARLSGFFPQVNNKPLSDTLHSVVEEFKQNAALGAILERRRALEGRAQYVLQSKEAMDAINRNLTPWARAGTAVDAKSARLAQQVAGVPADTFPDKAALLAQQVAGVPADSKTDKATMGAYTVGGSESSTRVPSSGQGTLQSTFTGALGKSKPKRSQPSKPLLGTTQTNTLKRWQQMP